MDYQEFSQHRERFPYDPDCLIDKQDRLFIYTLDSIHKEVQINKSQASVRDRLEQFTQLNQYQTHVFETNQDNSKDLVTVNESLKNDHAVSNAMKNLTSTRSNFPVYIDPRTQLETELIEERYQIRAEEDQERMRRKIEEERQMK